MMAEPDSEREPQKRDKRAVVEATDHEGSLHVSDVGSAEAADGDTPLIADVSADVSPVVEEFMEQAAQQNEAAAEAVADVKNKPGPYISFEHVSKSFGEFVVLEDVSFHRYNSFRDRALLFWWTLLENLGYRQLTVFWRLRGLWKFFRGHKEWGVMERKGFRPITAAPTTGG